MGWVGMRRPAGEKEESRCAKALGQVPTGALGGFASFSDWRSRIFHVFHSLASPSWAACTGRALGHRGNPVTPGTSRMTEAAKPLLPHVETQWRGLPDCANPVCTHEAAAGGGC